MVMPGFPGANLIGQLLRQVTQPLSMIIVRHVKKRPFLRKYVLIQLGRFYFWCEDKVAQKQNIRAVGRKKEKQLADDTHTMEVGAKLLVELLVFGILWSVIVYETHKAMERGRTAEKKKIQEFDELEEKKNLLIRRVEDQVILTKQLKEIIAEYSREVECALPSDPDEKEGE